MSNKKLKTIYLQDCSGFKAVQQFDEHNIKIAFIGKRGKTFYKVEMSLKAFFIPLLVFSLNMGIEYIKKSIRFRLSEAENIQQESKEIFKYES